MMTVIMVMVMIMMIINVMTVMVMTIVQVMNYFDTGARTANNAPHGEQTP